MAAERNPSNAVPTEIIRQGERILEQYNQLNKMLDKIHTDLQGTAEIMRDFNSELADEIKKLDDSVQDYDITASKIYNDLSNNLKGYGTNLIYNLDGFKSNISKLVNLLKTLKS